MSLNWKLEDEKEPYLNIFFESQAHKHCTSLVVRNDGGGPAYNIRIDWNNALHDIDGKIVRFTDLQDGCDVYCLPPGMHVTRFVNSTESFFKGNEDAVADIFSGTVEYSTTSRKEKNRSKSFRVTMGTFKRGLMTTGDQMDFYFNNRNLAQKITELSTALNKFAQKEDPDKDQ